MPPEVMKSEALYQVAILRVSLATAFDEDPRLYRGWANVIFDQHGCRARTFSMQLDAGENIVPMPSIDRLFAPLGENVEHELRNLNSAARQDGLGPLLNDIVNASLTNADHRALPKNVTPA